MATGKKFFWLKLHKDFFKRHDIRIIESMENGKDYILFYLKLLVESVSHEGDLRFSQTIPYDDKMLATITNTNIDVVRSAIKIFSELQLMEILDDKTIHMSETVKMLGYETDWAKQKREFRDLKRLPTVDSVRVVSASCPPIVHQELDIELEKESEKKTKGKETPSGASVDVPKPRKVFQKPTIAEITAYCTERNNTVDPQTFLDFYESKGWVVGKSPMKDWKSCVRTWEQRRNTEGKTKKPDVQVDWLAEYMRGVHDETPPVSAGK